MGIYYSICILTYKRNLLLDGLLNSLLNQKNVNFNNIEIIIVDNDKSGNAKEIVESFRNKTNMEIKYFIQPIKNISLTRNIALQNAKGDLIAIIDDDETADKYWLYNLIECLNKYDADGVFGLVVPRFEDGIPDKFKKREYYFSPMDVTGSEAKFMFTGNVLFKSELIKNKNILFDPEYGLTGGEDADFFYRLKLSGAKFVECREAVSYEFISKERTKSKFFLKRNIRGGQTYIRTRLKQKDNFIIRIILITKSIFKVIYGGIIYLAGILNFDLKIRGLIFIGSGLGEISAIFGKYKNIHAT